MDVLRDPIWQFVGVAVTLVPVLVSLVVYLFDHKNRKPLREILKIAGFVFVATCVILGIIIVALLQLPNTSKTSANSTPTSIGGIASPVLASSTARGEAPTSVSGTATPVGGTTSPDTYTLAHSYDGTITTDMLNYTDTLSLTTVGQNGGNISGRVQFGSLSGSGPFTGTIAANGHIRFTITNADDGYGPSDFDGYILPDGTMSGTYVNHSLNYKGNWQVHPPS